MEARGQRRRARRISRTREAGRVPEMEREVREVKVGQRRVVKFWRRVRREDWSEGVTGRRRQVEIWRDLREERVVRRVVESGECGRGQGGKNWSAGHFRDVRLGWRVKNWEMMVKRSEEVGVVVVEGKMNMSGSSTPLRMGAGRLCRAVRLGKVREKSSLSSLMRMDLATGLLPWLDLSMITPSQSSVMDVKVLADDRKIGRRIDRSRHSNMLCTHQKSLRRVSGPGKLAIRYSRYRNFLVRLVNSKAEQLL